MKIAGILLLKLKNTVKYRHNLLMMLVLPVIAAAGAWALLAFYIEGGASIPVGIVDNDRTEFSELAISRFSAKSSVGIHMLDELGVARMPDAAGGARILDAADGLAPEAADSQASVASDSFMQVASDSLRRSDGELERLVQTGALEEVLIINPGFEEGIKKGNPENIFKVVCSASSVTRGLVAELFAAEVSRIYFDCDSANRVVRDAAAAARAARKPRLTEAEQREIYDEAFAYCDSYWEPQPLMTIEYEKLETSTASAADAILAGAGQTRSWNDMRDMLNRLIARIVYLLFFTYAAFCVLNAAGAMAAERDGGILARMRATGVPALTWIAISAAAPFILYGIPCAALLAYLTKSVHSAVFAVSALLGASLLGASASYIIKRPGGYKVFTLLGAIMSMCTALILL